MPRGVKTDPTRIAEARRLRLEERLSIGELIERTGINRATLSVELRDIRLTPEEIKARRRRHYRKSREQRLSEKTKIRSPFADIIAKRAKTTDQKGAIAEAAAIFRMKVWGYCPYQPLCPHGKVDVLVEVPSTKRVLRVQVRMAARGSYGRPVVRLYTVVRSKASFRRNGDYDFIVGYDPEEDICYVYAESEIRTSRSMSLQPSAAEAWEKLLRPG